jgi:hypothetical protein
MITNTKTLFLKIAGVTPDEIAVLHKNLAEKTGVTMSEKHVRIFRSFSSGSSKTDGPLKFVEIIKSEVDPKTQLYTVEVRLNAAIACQHCGTNAEHFLLAPRAALDQVIACFEGLLPPQEEFPCKQT